MSDRYNIIVIGAGPAGMSAAIEAARHGASVCLLDEQSSAGGQIYRGVEQAGVAQSKFLGSEYIAGRALVSALQGSSVIHRKCSTIWKVSKDGSVAFSISGRAFQCSARHIIIANGAIERPMPVPGWTTPGVLTVGAAQILMKSAGVVPKEAVLIGAGPLIYLVATQLILAGSPPKALIETQTKRDLLRAIRHFVPALRSWRQLVKGVQMLGVLRRAGVQRFTGSTNIEIDGGETVSGVRFRAHGSDQEINTKVALLHLGVVPSTQISRSLGLEHIYDSAQFCFKPVAGELGQSSNPVISIAGDGAGIGGAVAAELSGRLSAIDALRKIGRIKPNQLLELQQQLLAKHRSELAIRPFLDAAYPPPKSVLCPDDETILCRCEDVKAGDIRRYAALGCMGPNQTKSFGRSGMGPCQGRFCGQTVTEILAQETGQHQDTVGSYRIRAPLKPITLKEMASLGCSEIAGNTK